MAEVFSPLDDDEYAKQIKEFQKSKAGVKGLADSGATKIPRIFIHPPHDRPNSISEEANNCKGNLPLIDFEGLRNGKRTEIVNQIREGISTWGFFQIVNHGIPTAAMDKMLGGVRNFHEQPQELKEEWYSNDPARKVRFYSVAYAVSTMAAYWKDTIMFGEAQQLEKEALPPPCREGVMEYTKYVMLLKETICELLSEALGLSSESLANSGVTDSVTLVGNYYPTCPEPDLTWGVAAHRDPNFLTLLSHDNIGGLQILYQNNWVDVTPVHGAIILNIGDLMQLLTNDKLKSVEHRVRLVKDTSRASVAAFFYPPSAKFGEPFGPIKELLSENNPPIYRETSFKEYAQYRISNGRKQSSCLPYFKLSS